MTKKNCGNILADGELTLYSVLKQPAPSKKFPAVTTLAEANLKGNELYRYLGDRA